MLVLLDGVEVNSNTAGSFDFANLTTDNTSRIEVLRGAGGSLYGSSAIGGVINVLSQEGTGAPKFSLLSDGGNWETSAASRHRQRRLRAPRLFGFDFLLFHQWVSTGQQRL